MKKSRILAPALAVLTFSTAAAVTGTVAWYFSSRTAAIQASAITSYNPEAGLKVTLTAGEGTTIGTASSTIDSTPATVTHDLMRDGSVDVPAGKAYIAVLDRQGNVSSYRQVDDLKDGTNTAGKDYYFATTYTAKFELNNQTSGKAYALYYDHSKLATTGDSDVGPSLRIALKFSASNYLVIAPFDEDGTKTYVSGGSLGSFSDDVFFAATDGANLTGLDNSVADGNKDSFKGYIGDLQGSGSLTATVYTWFEGSDPSSLAENVDDEPLSSKLSFTLAEIYE